MAPLNAIPSGNASPPHSSGQSSNNLANSTPSRSDRDDRRRTNARRSSRKFLVYPVDQMRMVSNHHTGEMKMNGTKMDKTNKNGMMRYEPGGLKMEQNGMEKNGLKMEQNGMEKNGLKMEQDGMEKNGRRSDSEKEWTNGMKTEEMDGIKMEVNGSATLLFMNGLFSVPDKLRTKDELDTTGLNRMSFGLLDDEMENNKGIRLEREQCNMTNGLEAGEDAPLGSETGRQCSSSLYAHVEDFLLPNGHQPPPPHFEPFACRSLSEMPNLSSALLSNKKEEEQQLLINAMAQSSPTVATTTTKSSKFGETRALRRRLSSRVDVLQVPSVAVPCGSSAPERLGIRRSKVIMLGDSGVGKTSIVFSYKYGPNPGLLMSSCNATIGASYTNFDISVFNNVRVQLQLWDTAGQERFRCMVPMYMRNASAAILVYDITDRDSFDQIDEWHSEVMRCPTAVDEPTIVLIGNKADQNDLREVAEGEGVSKALRLNAHFFELSAVDTEVIRTIFNLVAEKIVHKCANVESAREADETMFEADSETGEDVAGGESGDTSPVIRLGNGGGGWEPFRTELGEWARLISCRSWWGYSEKTAATNGGSSCCSAL